MTVAPPLRPGHLVRDWSAFRDGVPIIFPSTSEPAGRGAGAGVLLRGPEKYPPR
jgi:hypothetical protein